MGGRGASLGKSLKGHKYGTEYTTLYQEGNIKFVSHNNGSANTPMETMTLNRIYGSINKQGKLKSLAYYDKKNKRYKQIDLEGNAHVVNGKPLLPHTHKGYNHSEYGTRGLTPREQKLVVKAVDAWYNRGKR